jgi:acyl carrier protein
MSAAVESEIKAFVVENFLFGQGQTLQTADQSLLESGIIDSTGMLELVTFIEQRYGIVVEDRELVPDNLDSLSNLGAFVDRKLTIAGAKR